MLDVRQVSKEFEGLVALSGVSFTVREKEIKALIGPNGAGKTTLFNVVCGSFPCTHGEIFFRDRNITRLKSHQICRLGMGRTFQIPRLFKQMTVLENVKTGCFPWTRSDIIACALKTPACRNEAHKIQLFSEEILKAVGLRNEADTLAEKLPIGAQKLLEIGRALATKPVFLLLDEPAGGLNDRETEQLADTILMLRNSLGITILLVEHDMNLVMDIADTIVVLNHGEKIAEGTPEEIQRNEDVIAAYLGREMP
jgi:branched-chain amino acid transport system ATP-binding protein